MTTLFCLSLFLFSSAAPAAPVLSLQQALETAQQQQPQALMAHAQQLAAQARVQQALAPMLPQLTGQFSYQRTTANYVQRPGAVPAAINVRSSELSGNSYNFFTLQATASQLLYDFGSSQQAYRASQALRRAQDQNSLAVHLQIQYNVRSAYFAAHAAQAMLEVGRQNLANIDKHLLQIKGLIAAGTRSSIDLASVRNDLASAQVLLLGYENDAQSSKLLLNQAMGIVASDDYRLCDAGQSAVDGEDEPWPTLIAEAQAMRPELSQLDQQIAAQTHKTRSLRGQYFPSLNAQATVSDQGQRLDHLSYNWSAQAILSWNISAGGLQLAQVREAQATHANLRASRLMFVQQLQVAVQNAQLAVRAAKLMQQAAKEALTNAEQQLALADGRYNTGVGTILELGDAQLAVYQSAAQHVQAGYSLATARAQLLLAVGRRHSWPKATP